MCRCGAEQCRGAMGKRTDGKNQPVQEKPKPRAQNRITQTKKNINSTSTASIKKSINKQTPTANKKAPAFKVVKTTSTKKTVNKHTVKSTVIKTPGRKPAATPQSALKTSKSQSAQKTAPKPLMSSQLLNKTTPKKTPIKKTYGRAARLPRSIDKKDSNAKLPATHKVSSEPLLWVELSNEISIGP